MGKSIMQNCLNAKGVKPFVDTVQSTFEMMVGMSAEPTDCYPKDETPIPGTITGVIGLAGEKIMGVISVKFTQKLLLKVFSSMVGEEVTEIRRDVLDTVAELANIVAGSGKSALAPLGIHFEVTIPSVVIGPNHSISYGENSTAVIVPFKMEDEMFYLEIMMKKV